MLVTVQPRFSTICRGSTTFDPQTAYDELEILGQNLSQICRKGSSKYIPGTQDLAPHTPRSRFSMTPSDWRRNGCFRHQGVALRQRDRWIWRLEICDALEAENVSTHAHVAVLCSLGIQFWDILGINQFWAIPLSGDLGCPFGGRNRGMTWAPKVLRFFTSSMQMIGEKRPNMVPAMSWLFGWNSSKKLFLSLGCAPNLPSLDFGKCHLEGRMKLRWEMENFNTQHLQMFCLMSLEHALNSTGRENVLSFSLCDVKDGLGEE